MISRIVRYVLVSFSLLALTGCGIPYALNVHKINLGAKQKRGVIQFSDPKLFPREHLINERLDDLAFLKNALAACNDADIQPEVIREIEVVRVLAAGVGLNVDPAAARNFESEVEIAELKNDIAKTRLEMQLAQLRRDAELLKERLNAQEAPVNQPPTLENDPPAAVPVSGSLPGPTVAEVNSLLEKVDKLVNDLQADARANVAALTQKGGNVGPIDTFNHRKACRDTVKNVINQTRLDELHDMDGNALVRLQVRATVLPGEDGYGNTLGILRMELHPPVFDNADPLLPGQIYRNWLEYVNQNINLPPAEPDVEEIRSARIRTAPRSLNLQEYFQLRYLQELRSARIRTAPRFLNLQEYFQLRYLEIPKIITAGRASDTIPNEACMGLWTAEIRSKQCWYLRVALPLGSADLFDILIQAPDRVADLLRGAAKSIRAANLSEVATDAENFAGTCDVGLLDNETELRRLNNENRPGTTAHKAAKLAVSIRTYWPNLITVSRALTDSFESKSYGDDIRTAAQRAFGSEVSVLIDAANEVLNAIGAKFPNCQQDRFLSLSTPTGFTQAIGSSAQRVAAYDVAPAERVQGVSTAARVTEALALAASIAGTFSKSGLGARTNLAFSRSAVGKADAMELVPIVVGFTEPVHTKQVNNSGNSETKSSFGWLLGPKAVIDAENQDLALVHPVKPYELYADLSLPGWWPWFRLKTYTAWAPNWRRTDSAATMDIASSEKLVRTIEVPMNPNAGDMDGLTTVLLKAAAVPLLGAPQIVRVEPSEVSRCGGRTDFQIWGENVWRVSMVHMGGRAIDREQTAADGSMTTAIKVLPDMRGIVASIDISNISARHGEGVDLTVWTPNGRDTTTVSFYDILQKDKTCREKDKGPRPSDLELPTISAVRPERVSICAGSVKFQLLGTNLTAKSQINVGGAAATNIKVLPSKGGLTFDLNVASVVAIEDQTASVSVSTEGGEASTTLAFSEDHTARSSCASARVLRPTISALSPKGISACAGTVKFQLLGTNLTAKSQINIGGAAATDVKVLPSKGGLSFDLNVASVAAIENQTASVSVSTEGGEASTTLVLSDIRVGGNGCKSAEELQRPSISGITPSQISVCASKATLIARGRNLGQAVDVRFGGVAVSGFEVLPPRDGTLARFEVDFEASRNNFAGMTKATAEIRTGHGLATAEVDLVGKPANCR